MAAEYLDLEMYVIVDEAGEYAIGKDTDEANEAYAQISEDMTTARRVIVVRLRVPKPEFIEVSATVPAEAATVENLTVK